MVQPGSHPMFLSQWHSSAALQLALACFAASPAPVAQSSTRAGDSHTTGRGHYAALGGRSISLQFLSSASLSGRGTPVARLGSGPVDAGGFVSSSRETSTSVTYRVDMWWDYLSVRAPAPAALPPPVLRFVETLDVQFHRYQSHGGRRHRVLYGV
jgi:hypothetical protein